MNIIKTMQNGVLKFELEGRLDSTTAPELEESVNESIGDASSIIFDFTKLEYLPSAGLRILLTSQQLMEEKGLPDVTVRGANSDIIAAFEVTGFDVFLPDGSHMRFERQRSKEVFAYLVHRHGSSCTTREIAAALFEDEPFDKKQQNHVQQLIYAMIKSLKAVGAEAAVVRSYNALAVNPDVPDCDYYRFKELDAGAVNAYQNEYMSQYYWADFLFDEGLGDY